MTQRPQPPSPARDAPADCTRRLVLVPILHAPADMGSLGEGLVAAMIDRLGRRHWEEYVLLVDGFWQAVRAELEGLALDCGRVDLYQDGLPVCGKERKIVEAAAAAGSENHQLLLDLAGRGAALIGTEDPGLLLEEYRDAKAALDARRSGIPARQAGADCRSGILARQAGTPAPNYQDRLTKRDAWIARRIGQTLGPGGTGILFLGMMHNIEPHLPPDIVVTRLVPAALARKGSPHGPAKT